MPAKRSRSLRTEFSRLLSTGVTLVDFNAPWCRPCRQQAPIIKRLEGSFRETVRVKIVNIDKYKDIALNLGIQSIPTIIIFKNGKEMNRFIGLQSAETLERALKAVIKHPQS